MNFSFFTRLFLLTGLLLLLFGITYYFSIKRVEKSLKVGIIHSLSGDMSSIEEAVMESTLLAIDEINKNGGLLNRVIEPIILDSKSNNDTFAKQAENLIKNENVEIIFGGLTPTSRKSLKQVVEKYDKLLFFPGFNEGLEESKNIFYTGPVSNQYLISTLTWILNNLGNKIYLLGSNNYFSKIINKILDEIAPLFGIEIVGQKIIAKRQKEINDILNNIETTNTQVIISTLNLNDSLLLFNDIKNLKEKKNIPIFAIGLTQNELSFASDLNNVYLVGNYFENIDSKESDAFNKKIKEKYGKSQEVNDYIQSAYIGVQLWAQAVNKVKSFDIHKITNSVINSKLNAPEGLIYVDQNHYLYKTPRILKISDKPQIIWSNNQPIQPLPYPNDLYIEKFNSNKKDKEYWINLVNELSNQKELK